MIDVVTLALAKKYTDEYSVIVEPADVEAAVDKYLEEHPVQPTPIDDTLTIQGDAADAKAVGDAIQEIYEYLEAANYIKMSDIDRVDDKSIENLF